MQRVPPPQDDYPETLELVIRALLENGRDAGGEALAPIAYTRQDLPKRRGLGRAVLGLVFRRDRFTCRYCGGLLIPTPIMELIGDLYPEAFPFHSHWKGGETHPAVLSRSPIADHIDPGAKGGDWMALENLVTACWSCNSRKADFTLAQLDWELLPVPEIDWDGLTRYYADLWRAAGEPKPNYHRAWMTALDCAPARP